jgi:hypothetical protein
VGLLLLAKKAQLSKGLPNSVLELQLWTSCEWRCLSAHFTNFTNTSIMSMNGVAEQVLDGD